MQALVCHDKCVHTQVCPQEGRMHTCAPQGVPSTVWPWWQLLAPRMLYGQGRCSKGHWQIPHIHCKPCTLTGIVATCNLICIAFMAYQQCCWGACNLHVKQHVTNFAEVCNLVVPQVSYSVYVCCRAGIQHTSLLMSTTWTKSGHLQALSMSSSTVLALQLNERQNEHWPHLSVPLISKG